MPIFIPPDIMKYIPSTMSFLYQVGGEIEHQYYIPSDPTNFEQWSTLSKYMTKPYSWDEYTSTIKNIRVYKGITSTIQFIQTIGASIQHSDEFGDDPNTKEEWSTFTHYMTPKYSWECYLSTMNNISINNRFNIIENKVVHSLSICDYVFNNINASEISNISDWVIYKRNIIQLLSTPSALIKDYERTLDIYPIEPPVSSYISSCIGSNFKI